jgi:hypothetical protein
MTYETMTYAERVSAERATARNIVSGLRFWQAYCYADTGTAAEFDARHDWTQWLDRVCDGHVRHPLANRVRELHDQLGGIASLYNAGELA